MYAMPEYISGYKTGMQVQTHVESDVAMNRRRHGNRADAQLVLILEDRPGTVPYRQVDYGCFRVKDVRRLLDDMLLPKSDVPSRWVKQIPIKVNVLAWKISMDRLPTRVNLHRRGVQVSPISCPICCEALENLDHLLFCCDLAKISITFSSSILIDVF
ncbi:RNA-directed DNA polymerase, eukaryota [Tanacetum coccineum]